MVNRLGSRINGLTTVTICIALVTLALSPSFVESSAIMPMAPSARAVQNLTIYLHDDGTFSAADVVDFMNMTTPTCATLQDFDADGVPGTSLDRGNTHDFVLIPYLAGDLHIFGDVEVVVWARAASARRMGIQYNLYDYDGGITYTLLGSNFDQNGGNNWPTTLTPWYLNLTAIDHTVPAGNTLVLRISRNDLGGQPDLMHLAYNTTAYPSRINVPTDTLINVTKVWTADVAGTPKTVFGPGEDVVIWSNVSSPFTATAIQRANLTVRDPSSNIVVPDTAMALRATDPGIPSGWKTFNHSYHLPPAAPLGNYSAEVTGFGAGGLISKLKANFTVVTANAPPVMTTLTDMTVDEDAPPFDINFTTKATDAEDAQALLAWQVSSFNASIVQSAVNIGNGTFRFTLEPDAFGATVVDMLVRDTKLASDAGNFTITVRPINDPPKMAAKVPDMQKMEDAANWTYDLTGLASDPDDAQASLGWSVSDVNSSLLTVAVNGNQMNFSLVANASGNDDLVLRLADDGTAYVEQTFWVNVTPVNDPPVWKTVPGVVVGDKTQWDDLRALRVYVSDIDNATTDLALTLLSYTNNTLVTFAIDGTGHLDLTNAPDEFHGVSTVIVRASDGIDHADATFRVSFDLNKTIPPVEKNITMRLASPYNGSVVYNSTITLSWNAATNATNPSYLVYLSANGTLVKRFDPTVLAVSTMATSYDVPGQLINGTTYFWTVVPLNGTKSGINKDGVWSFKVDLTPQPPAKKDYSFDIRTNVTIITVKQGEEGTVEITVVSIGDTATTVSLTGSGGCSEVSFDRSTVPLVRGEAAKIVITVKVPKSCKTGSYSVSVNGVSAEDAARKDSLSVPLTVQKGKPASTDPFAQWWLLPLLVIMIIASIIGGVVIGTRASTAPKRPPPVVAKRRNEDDEKPPGPAAMPFVEATVVEEPKKEPPAKEEPKATEPKVSPKEAQPMPPSKEEAKAPPQEETKAAPKEEPKPEPKAAAAPVKVQAVALPPHMTAPDGLDEIVLVPGEALLILEKEGNMALNVFKKYVDQGAKGLAITHLSPVLVNEKYGLSKARVLWITIAGVEEDALPATNWKKIKDIISNHIEKSENGILLFEGALTLAKVHDIELVFNMLEDIKQKVSGSKCIGVFSMDPSGLNGGQIDKLQSLFELVESY